MTYQALEIGAVGSPIELFTFHRGTSCWLYTSSDATQVFQARSYQPVTISRGAFERNDEAGSSSVEVRVDRTLKVVSQFLDGSTPEPVGVTIHRKHRTDSEFIVLFKGIVANAELVGEEVSLRCVSPLSADEKSIPRQLIMRTCPHVLYGPRCLLDPTDYAVAGTVSSINGNIVSVSGITSAWGNDYFTAGMLVHDSTGYRAFVQYYRYFGIAQFTLLQPPPFSSGAVTAYAGCDRKHSTCRDKFSNIPNFGGFPLHPERNPILDLKGS